MAVRLLMLLTLVFSLYYQWQWGKAAFQLLMLICVLAVSNIVFWFVGRDKFESRRSYSLILLFDVGMVSVLVAYLGVRSPVFFMAYFLAVFAAALSQRVWVAVVISVAASAVLATAFSLTGGASALITENFFLRIALLFVTSLLAGYLAEAMEAERMIAVNSNPTTGLPGYSLIRSELERRIRSSAKFAVCYIDNDNFKAYNDYYGYAKGDALIKTTGRVITESVRKMGNPADFVGHVGGDDFLVVTTPDRVDRLCNHINLTFRRAVRAHYDTIALKQGFIKSHDRKGVSAVFPVMSLSIGVVSNENREIKNPDQVAQTAAKLKKKAKTHKSRVYVTSDFETGEFPETHEAGEPS